MVRRRTLKAPDPEALARIGQGLAAGAAPPIAKIAAEAAGPSATATDAAAWREAQAAGRVIAEIPIDAIDLDHVTRDRTHVDPAEMDELVASIRASGLRLPVEVAPTSPGRYGLISGFRRIQAVRTLHERGHGVGTIRALVVEGQGAAEAYVAMVEENEVRAGLTPYERGRVAVVAAAEGAFADAGAAVEAIYASASKAKRSKIRSFAAVHEALGDALRFPEALTERGGLRLAQAIRSGAEPGLRQALATPADDPAAEWRAIEGVLSRVESAPASPKPRVGRPRKAAQSVALQDGVRLSRSEDARGHTIRIEGPGIDAALVEEIMADIARRLGAG